MRWAGRTRASSPSGLPLMAASSRLNTAMNCRARDLGTAMGMWGREDMPLWSSGGGKLLGTLAWAGHCAGTECISAETVVFRKSSAPAGWTAASRRRCDMHSLTAVSKAKRTSGGMDCEESRQGWRVSYGSHTRAARHARIARAQLRTCMPSTSAWPGPLERAVRLLASARSSSDVVSESDPLPRFDFDLLRDRLRFDDRRVVPRSAPGVAGASPPPSRAANCSARWNAITSAWRLRSSSSN